MSTEPTNFLTLMNSGKAFSSFDGMACCYQCFDLFQFLQGHWQGIGFLETFKNPANLIKNNLNNAKNNMKSQIQNNDNNNNNNNNINNGGIVEGCSKLEN